MSTKKQRPQQPAVRKHEPDWAALKALTDEEIAAQIAADPDVAPEWDWSLDDPRVRIMVPTDVNCRHKSAGQSEATGDDGRRHARPTPVDPAADHRCRQNPCKRSNSISDRGRSARDAKIGSDRIEENRNACRLAGQGHERAEGAGAQYDPAIMESRSSGAHRPHVINPPGARCKKRFDPDRPHPAPQQRHGHDLIQPKAPHSSASGKVSARRPIQLY